MLVASLATVVWALLTLLSGGGPGAAVDLGPASAARVTSPEVDQAQATTPAPEKPSGTTGMPPRAYPASLADHARTRAATEGGRPVRVLVPEVGVDAPVDPVGVQDDGQMEIPEDSARAGWYRFGPAPGDEGSAVVAGHVDDRWGGAGALAPLHDVRPGDEVLVEHADGRRTTYLVESRESVGKIALAVDRLFARSGDPRLVLVTCTGEWSEAEGHYAENLVVSARPRDP